MCEGCYHVLPRRRQLRQRPRRERDFSGARVDPRREPRAQRGHPALLLVTGAEVWGGEGDQAERYLPATFQVELRMASDLRVPEEERSGAAAEEPPHRGADEAHAGGVREAVVDEVFDLGREALRAGADSRERQRLRLGSSVACVGGRKYQGTTRGDVCIGHLFLTGVVSFNRFFQSFHLISPQNGPSVC